MNNSITVIVYKTLAVIHMYYTHIRMYNNVHYDVFIITLRYYTCNLFTLQEWTHNNLHTHVCTLHEHYLPSALPVTMIVDTGPVPTLLTAATLML